MQPVQQKCPEHSLHTLPAAQVTYALILWPLLPWGLVHAAPKMQRMRPAGEIARWGVYGTRSRALAGPRGTLEVQLLHAALHRLRQTAAHPALKYS
jgi:hypothetical protein